MKIYGQIQKIARINPQRCQKKISKHYRKSLCLDPVFGLYPRDHCWIGPNETMIQFYESKTLDTGRRVAIEGEIEKYPRGGQISITPTKIQYL